MNELNIIFIYVNINIKRVPSVEIQEKLRLVADFNAEIVLLLSSRAKKLKLLILFRD